MSISKIPSLVAMPITKTVNQLYFTTSDERPVDMKASYVELEMGLTTDDKYNVVLGHDGLMYPPSCLFRSSKLTKTQTGEVVQDLTYVNVLDANMRHYSVGCNQVPADAIFSGAGHVTPENTVLSVFNNTYTDQNPTLKVPLESLYPGSLGQSPLVPMGSGDVEMRFLMEPQYPVLMRAVPSGVYDQGTTVYSIPYAFNNVNLNTTTLSASALGTIANFATGNPVIIKGTVGGGGGVQYWVRTVGTVTPDAPPNQGSFTITTALSTTQAVSQVTVQKILPTTYILGCNNVLATTNSLTLNTSYPANQDLRGTTGEKTKVKVYYDVVSVSGAIESKVLETSIASTTGSNIVSVTLADNITLTSQTAFNIWIEPLYTNIDAVDWSVKSAHLVLYRRNMKVKDQKIILQNFESVNVQCVGGLNRFMYNYKVRTNTYNVWAIQPTATNLYGVVQDIKQYLFSLDERPLTSIYIDTDSAVHQDNIMRCGSNSPTYKIKNLRGNRDTQINSVIQPIMFPAKLFNAMVNGEDNVQPEGQDRNLRIELVPNTTTQPCNVFLFMEKHQEL